MQVVRTDLVTATHLVANGYTYGEAAVKLGLTRNQVAGACRRAGVKAPMTPDKMARHVERQREKGIARWKAVSKKQRIAAGARLTASRSISARRKRQFQAAAAKLQGAAA